jgi:hypothetical protein
MRSPAAGDGTESDSELDVPGWLDNPERKIRNVVFGALLSGFGSLLDELFGAAELLVLGSQPATFGAQNEVWGLADLPGDVLGFLIRTGFDILANLIASTIPEAASPFAGLIATFVVVVLLVGVVRLGGPLLLAALEAIPVVGGPISTILGRFL